MNWWPPKTIAGLGMGLALLALAGQIPATAPPESFASDGAVQQQIDGVVSAIVRVNEGGDRSGLPDQISRLEGLARSRDRLLLELAWYLSQSHGTEQSMGAAVLIDHLNFSADEKIAAVVPQLDSSGGPWLRSLTELLSTVDRPRGEGPDFTPYEPLLSQAAGGPPEGLVRYMYDVSPGDALSALAQVYVSDESEAGSLTRAIQTVERALEGWRQGGAPSRKQSRVAKDRLDLLSRNATWWVRLYVATTLRNEPRLEGEEVVARLREDEHRLVRQAAGN